MTPSRWTLLLLAIASSACASSADTPVDEDGVVGDGGSAGAASVAKAGASGSVAHAGNASATAGHGGAKASAGAAGASSGAAGKAGGNVGTAGSPGASGSAGSAGSSGAQGTAGMVGSAGAQGTAGTVGSAGASGSGAAGAPATVDDAEGEPTVAELAKDPHENSECYGPFDCYLPNPAGTNRNRVTNPLDGTDLFPLAPNTDIVDGMGNLRGQVTSTKIMINYGQRKTLLGAPHVYAFAVGTTNGVMSSWVRESAVKQSLAFMPTVLAQNPGKGDYDQVFTVTGGDPSLYGDDKVIPNFTMNNGAATDYLVRPGNVVNLLYGFRGGVSDDTMPIGPGTKFRRAKGVPSFYYNLYAPGSSTVIGTQRFFYGHIDGRYGWIARDTLDPPPAKPGPSKTYCCAKCSMLMVPHQAESGKQCTIAAEEYCAAKPTRGAFQSASFGDCIP